jgi:regulator of protease activity HflC (stomatin/prohibitin superfamily)
MSMTGLYRQPSEPTDAERKAKLKAWDDERRARWEAEAKAEAEADRVKREAQAKIDKAEADRKAAERLEAEESAIAALSKADMVRMIWGLQAEVAKLKGLTELKPKDNPVASIHNGQLSNGTMYGAREPLVDLPPWKRQANWNG